MNFDKNFFIKQIFSQEQLSKYKKSAKRDLDIALKSDENEVKFHFAYMSLIKIGIYCIAKIGYRVKSRPGHHQKIIEYLGVILNNEDIIVIGDKMRKERNLDFYDAGLFESLEDLTEYIDFIGSLYRKI